MSAPRVGIGPKETPGSITAGFPADPIEWREQFLKAFGTAEAPIAEDLFNQIVNTLHNDPTKPIAAETANLALALLHRLAPRNELEAMLCVQLVVAHVASMETSRRGMHADQSTGGRQAYLGLARKFMTLFTAQAETLHRLRGNGVVQKVIVERVNVAAGGQAVVGAVSSRPGGGEGHA